MCPRCKKNVVKDPEDICVECRIEEAEQQVLMEMEDGDL